MSVSTIVWGSVFYDIMYNMACGGEGSRCKNETPKREFVNFLGLCKIFFSPQYLHSTVDN